MAADATLYGSRPEPSPAPAGTFSPGRTACRRRGRKLRRRVPAKECLLSWARREAASPAPRFRPTAGDAILGISRHIVNAT